MGTAALMGRMVVSLAVVVALMALTARVLRNRAGFGGMGRKSSAPSIEVVARQGVGKSTSIAIVRTGSKELVVGVTENSVNLLAEYDRTDQIVLTDEVAEQPVVAIAAAAAPSTKGAHWTALPGGLDRPRPTRMNLLEAIREVTVRRS
jgi:flagellar biogenesis protein FliO